MTNRLNPLLLAGALLLAGNLSAAEDGAAWFERMRNAMQHYDYEGRFVYQVGEQLESMYVVHRVSGGAELERLVSLNGDSREVIRGDRAVACLQPGRHLVSVIEGAKGVVPGDERTGMERIREHYRFDLAGIHRVAGREAQLVEVLPRDDLRFGHRLYLDRETGLPLRSVMLDTSGDQVAQLLFVELKTGTDVTTIEHDVSALQMTERERITVPAGVSSPEQSGWTFNGLPAGYQLVSFRDEPARKRQHLIFSDGIAVLSLYVEPPEDGALNGYSSVGATRIYAEPRHGMQVTAIGEVPRGALRMVVRALTPR